MLSTICHSDSFITGLYLIFINRLIIASIRVIPFSLDGITFSAAFKLKIKPNDWLLVDRKQPITALYSEFETVIKFYNLVASSLFPSSLFATLCHHSSLYTDEITFYQNMCISFVIILDKDALDSVIIIIINH